MSIFDDDDEERRSRSLADALATSMMRSVIPLMPAWSEQPGNADLITQAIADDAVGSPPHFPSFGNGTDIATPLSQDLFTEMLRRVRDSES
jgi:hypothetical protein